MDLPMSDAERPDHPGWPEPIHVNPNAGADPPDPADGPFVVERMTALTHDLANLLDGSLRCLSFARKALGRGVAGVDGGKLDSTRRQLDTVYGAMERMSDLVQAAMRGSSSVLSSAALSPRRPISLQEAVGHAMEVVSFEAAERGVSLELSVADDVSAQPAGAVYTVILNGLRNAIESISRACAGAPEPRGLVEVRARSGARAGPRGAPERLIVIEILDDGTGFGSRADGDHAFEFGVTTKPGGLGVGLALAREVIRELSGTIELLPRQDVSSATRPGALLRITFPFPKPRSNETIG